MSSALPNLPRPLWANEKTKWLSYAERVGIPEAAHNLPGFLTICPSKTGTSWLAHHFGRSPGVYIPPDKEVRYFDVLWRDRSIDWYRDQFAQSGGRLAGEATPSYALLPETAIETIHHLNPKLKLIFLARRLPERAWSHARHCWRYFEDGFRDRAGSFGELPAAQLVAHFISDYSLSSADYVGTLRRWLKYFPQEQFHVRYLEDAVANPEEYFANVCRFLGVQGPPSSGELTDPVNAGVLAEPPEWATAFLEGLFATRQNEIEAFLQRTFALQPVWKAASSTPESRLWLEDLPGGWRLSLNDGVFDALQAPSGERIQRPFLHDLRRQVASSDRQELQPSTSDEDSRLMAVLARLEEDFNASSVELVADWGTFNIVGWKRKFFGIRKTLGQVDVTAASGLTAYPADDFLVASTRGELEARMEAIEARRVVAALTRRFEGLGIDYAGDPAVPLLAGSFRGFNLVHYQNKVFALSHSLGPVDLRDGPENLQQRHGSDKVFWADSEALVLAHIQAAETDRQLADMRRRLQAADESKG